MNEQHIELLVLKNINQTISQKSIAQNIGYSVGKVNYVLKALISKGLVKKNNTNIFLLKMGLSTK